MGSNVPPNTPIFTLLPLPLISAAADFIPHLHPGRLQRPAYPQPAQLPLELAAHLRVRPTSLSCKPLQFRGRHDEYISILMDADAGASGLRAEDCLLNGLSLLCLSKLTERLADFGYQRPDPLPHRRRNKQNGNPGRFEIPFKLSQTLKHIRQVNLVYHHELRLLSQGRIV